jgi:RNA polymerase sigma factor (sigma-70 family)
MGEEVGLATESGEMSATGAFDDFFRGNFPAVARTAALVARDPGTGQDVAQEAFARLFDRWDRIDGYEHARRFVYRVAVNLARSHLRKYRRIRPSGLSVRDVPADDPSDRSDDWLSIVEALGRLSPRQRACVVLVDYAGMGAAAAAATLGTAEVTVRVHVMRGRRLLRSELGLRTEEPEP